jgi:beta-glucosidase
MPTTEHDDALSRHLGGLLERLDLAAKVRLLTGANHWELRDEPAIGLRPVVVADGPSGVRGVTWDERDPSVSLPSSTAIAASWDEELVTRLAGVLASEARRKGVDVVLGPTVNLHRSPRGGRHFECFSEDPLLTGRLGVAYVTALQASGVGATPKHYVANDSENERFTLDVRLDERALRELYLAPFERMVADAQPWLIMAAYNGVGGATMTENPLLAEPLKGAWGFDGVVISDWFATRSTEAAGRAAMDLAMPGPDGPWGERLVEAVRDGRVSEAAVDDKVRRLLLLAARVGALEGLDTDLPTPPHLDADAAGGLARGFAAAGMVLVRNPPDAQEGTPVLPLEVTALRRVAMIGPNAHDARIQGGGSATVFPAHAVSPLEGLRAALGQDIAVAHARGADLTDGLSALNEDVAVNPRTGEPGILASWRDGSGTEIAAEDRHQGQLRWLETIPTGARELVLGTRVRADVPGTWRVGVLGVGELAVVVDGNTVFDGVIEADTDAFDAAVHQPPERAAERELAVGDEVLLEVRIPVADHAFGLAITVGAQRPVIDPAVLLEEAVAAARDADVAVVVVGTTAEVESEGFDRSTLALPGNQDALVHAVAEANPRTVVVVNAGAPVLLPWRDDVAAVLLSWFGGQEYGHALADVLLGAVEPGGRLPTTWPDREEDVPVLDTTPADGVLNYTEGIHIGYRAWERAGAVPAYGFGAGLGYTTWHLDGLVAPAALPADGPLRVQVSVTNTGARAGKHVVQAYLARPDGEVERPVVWLAGFAVVRDVAPGATVTVELEVDARAFAHWSVDDQAWAVEPGAFQLTVGSSLADRPLRTTITAGTPA